MRESFLFRRETGDKAKWQSVCVCVISMIIHLSGCNVVVFFASISTHTARGYYLLLRDKTDTDTENRSCSAAGKIRRNRREFPY